MTKRVGGFILTFVKATVIQFFNIMRSKRKNPKQNCKSDTYSNCNDNFDRLTLFKVILKCESTMKLL